MERNTLIKFGIIKSLVIKLHRDERIAKMKSASVGGKSRIEKVSISSKSTGSNFSSTSAVKTSSALKKTGACAVHAKEFRPAKVKNRRQTLSFIYNENRDAVEQKVQMRNRSKSVSFADEVEMFLYDNSSTNRTKAATKKPAHSNTLSGSNVGLFFQRSVSIPFGFNGPRRSQSVENIENRASTSNEPLDLIVRKPIIQPLQSGNEKGSSLNLVSDAIPNVPRSRLAGRRSSIATDVILSSLTKFETSKMNESGSADGQLVTRDPSQPHASYGGKKSSSKPKEELNG